MQSNKTRTLVECAVMVALSAVLSMIKVYEAPLGGSVTLFSMAPIIVVGLRHGPKWGIATAFVYSITQLLLGLGSLSYVPTPAGIVLCILLDYIIAFTVLGAASFFRLPADASYKKRLLLIALAALSACVLRFVSHYLSGVVVWYEITKEGQWNDLVLKTGMWTYSAIYNASYMLPETVITIVAAPAMEFVLSTVEKRRSAAKTAK